MFPKNMPVSKTAKRALKSSRAKTIINSKIVADFEVAVRTAKKTKKSADIYKAFSLIDRAAKKNIIHKNKASRIKSFLSNLAPSQDKNKKK